MKDVQNTELFPRNLPDPECFQDQAASVGINDDSHVVLYDNTPFCGYFVGGRAWWMFKVCNTTLQYKHFMYTYIMYQHNYSYLTFISIVLEATSLYHIYK